jgi:sugar/nucleoside kinase (ribokinase family)
VRYDVAGLGNALMDALVRVPNDEILERYKLSRGLMHPVDHDKWHEVYEAVQTLGPGAGRVEIHTGGSCANTIAALAMMGGRCVYAGQVGEDQFGHMYAARMTEACGQHALRFSREGNTGKVLSIISASDAERTMLTDLGTATAMPEIGDFADTIRDSRLLHLTGYLFLGGPIVKATWEALEVAREAGVPISIDVADPFVVGAVKDDLWRVLKDYAQIAFLNAEEASALTGTEPGDAVHRVAEVVPTVIVKMGSRGSLVKHHGDVYEVGIHRTEALDTTGAGDAYAAGYLYGWLHSWSPARAGDLGARIAAMTVGQVGAVVRDVRALRGAVTDASEA